MVVQRRCALIESASVPRIRKSEPRELVEKYKARQPTQAASEFAEPFFLGFPEAFPFERDTWPQTPAQSLQSEPCAECGSTRLREPCPTSTFQATAEHQA